MKYIYIYCLFVLMLFGCEQSTEKMVLEKNDFEDGKFEYQLFYKDSLIAKIGFSDSGNLDYLTNHPKGQKQVVFFHNKTGIIKSKLKVDSLQRTNGIAYYFNKTSGNLSGVFNYLSGKKSGRSISYHDSIQLIESVMLYKEDTLFYKKSFDELGNHLKTEGNKEYPLRKK